VSIIEVVFDLRFIEWIILAMVASTTLLVVATLGLKGLRTVRESLHKRYYRRIESALEDYLLSGENQPELERLRPWERDRFLSPLMIERMALLRGTGREYLMRLATDLGLVDRYVDDLTSRRRWHRARAAEYLGYFGGESVVGPLGSLLSDEDETVRAVAARALARIGTRGATEILARTLNDPSELTRLRAAENLERLGDLAIVPLSGLLLELKAEGAVMAARVLGNLRARKARPALKSVLVYTWDEDVLAQATLALGKIGDLNDVPFIVEGAKSDSWPVRGQTANALGLIGEVSTIPVLKELATDKEWWVRLSACRALANMGPSGEQALLQILEGDDRYARDQVAATLEARGITRRMARNLTKAGKRGERARNIIRAEIRSGSTRYLRDLAPTLPDAERRDLEDLLQEHDGSSPPREEKKPVLEEPATNWTGTEGAGDDD
jgi:HEAT repeat protein